MDAARFNKIAEDHKNMLTALVLPRAAKAMGGEGEGVFYNAYLAGTEVVVLGYRIEEPGGHSRTRPVAIMVDEELFPKLRVDEEASRVVGGQDSPGQVL